MAITTTTTTTFEDIHPHIIKTHILPRLDGPSLSSTSSASSDLQTLCSDDALWAHVSNSTWPSTTHPRVQCVISTFPSGHRSFFHDSFPSLLAADITHNNRPRTWSKPETNESDNYPWPPSQQLISAVDIRYKDDVVFSTVEFTDTTNDFMSPAFRVELKNDNNVRRFTSIDLKVDELAGADQETLTHLKESVTLNWILIDPTLKRAGNLSSIKAVSARQDYMGNETILRYVTVLPGCEPNDVVQCRIEVVLGAGKGGVGLHVKEVTLKLQDMDFSCLSGREFLVITQGALLEENNVKRKVVGDEERRKMYLKFKNIKKERREWVKKEEENREFGYKVNFALTIVSFLSSLYFLSLMLRS